MALPAAIRGPQRRDFGARSALAFVLPVAIAALGLSALTGRPLILWNTTPSEPEGLYLASSARPQVGDLVALQTPAAAFPYADGHLGYLRRTPLLKTLAARPGDRVCAARGSLEIRHRQVGLIAARDSRGTPLPHWSQCRALTRNEVFVFSNRVPNSFDSRYFGPVSADRIIGVYRPLHLALGGA